MTLGTEPVLQVWLDARQQQIYLGDDTFVSRRQALALASAQAAAPTWRCGTIRGAVACLHARGRHDDGVGGALWVFGVARA